jgi:thymidylate synthase (FAD)
MKIIKPYFVIEDEIDGNKILKKIEKAGRTCYKSEDKITDESAKSFVAGILKSGHHSVIEHEKITVRVICDRGVSHEIVRHRIGSYSQESTRYCNYSKDKFGNEITVIEPCFWKQGSSKPAPAEAAADKYEEWKKACENAEKAYFKLLELGAKPEEARSVLPNSLKTEIVITYNLREWRHFFILRTSKRAHPQMREIATSILKEFKRLIPVVFDDIQPEENED